LCLCMAAISTVSWVVCYLHALLKYLYSSGGGLTSVQHERKKNQRYAEWDSWHNRVRAVNECNPMIAEDLGRRPLESRNHRTARWKLFACFQGRTFSCISASLQATYNFPFLCQWHRVTPRLRCLVPAASPDYTLCSIATCC